MKNMWYLDIRIQTFFTLMCGIVGLFKINRLLPFEKLILFIVWQNFFVDLYATYLAYNKIPNALLFNIHLLVQHPITLYIYTKTLTNKWLIYLTGFIILVGNIINISFFQKCSFNSYSIIPSLTFVAIFSYFILRKQITTEKNPHLGLFFWFALSNLFYATISVNILSSTSYANEIDKELAMTLFNINYISYIIWDVLIMLGFLWGSKKTKLSLS